MSLTWSELESQRRVAKEPTAKSEIDELRALADRNLRDAALPGYRPTAGSAWPTTRPARSPP